MRMFVTVASAVIAANTLCIVGTRALTTTPAVRSDSGQHALVTLRISGMTCSSCAAIIAQAAKKIDGVSKATVKFDTGLAELTYDPAKTDPARLAAALADSTGYKVTPAATLTADVARPAESSGQPMKALTTSSLREQFNASANSTRLVTILSPMCPACKGGQGAVARIFGQVQSEHLKGFVIWLPMKPGDNAESAGRQAEVFVDSRVQQGWDADGAIGDAFARTFNLKGRAWDVYAVYSPGIEWRGETPAKPTFWMHQLTADAGADQSLCLNPAALLREVERAVITASRRQR